MAFLVAQSARERYGIPAQLFAAGGSLQLDDPAAARRLAHLLNEALAREGRAVVGATDLHALWLLGRLIEDLLDRYLERHPGALQQILAALDAELGREAVDRALQLFARRILGEGDPGAEGGDGGARDEAPGGEAPLPAPEDATPDDRLVRFRDLLLFWAQRQNPALGPARILLDDPVLEADPAWQAVLSAIGGERIEQVPPGEQEGGLVGLLRWPALSAPGSLGEQLGAVERRFSTELGPAAGRISLSRDLIAEAEAPRLPPGPGPPPSFSELKKEIPAREEARFTADRSWMPRVVMLAKNVYVWLDQLSRQGGRVLRRLDEIPDRELDLLAERGITALWLIGVWERSRASQRIKQLCGNPDAVGSAYSIFSYEIAAELGGEEALEDLEARARQRGIRLAADMVPNHMGIDSPWLVERPELFLAVDEPPFPAYTFTGPDLSADPAVGIYLEDHYYDRSDAAVVFRHLDRRSGRERFIYHGNDGTSFPWNDTAQLDYLRPETRRIAIDTILAVARRFPVVRFDAAMTLAKKHYQRLWYPEPGKGGAIPSRAEHALTREQFDARMPEEFWREVVAEAQEAAPDTLLLAEAFWLLEAYFVRSLGMHRVYNSAFMNMMRGHDNARFRALLRETLAFDPRILERYVNFMSNPDERTARDQFGHGDRYFGACTLLATLPGLPMLAHGQVEGYAERYGMEYRRSYWNESPDPSLVARHELQIVPLLRRRELFARAADFRLYDVVAAGGAVCESVHAFSNAGPRGERSVVLFNNAPTPAAGRLRVSAPFADSGNAATRTELLSEALGLVSDPEVFCRFRDEATGREHLVASRELRDRGLAVDLGPYQARVLTGFAEETDTAGLLARLARSLAGRGVESVESDRDRLALEPLERSLRGVANAVFFRRLQAAVRWQGAAPIGAAAATAIDERFAAVAAELLQWLPAGTAAAIADRAARRLRVALALPGRLATRTPAESGARPTGLEDEGIAAAYLRRVLTVRPLLFGGLWAWALDVLVREAAGAATDGPLAAWQSGEALGRALEGLDAEPRRRERSLAAVAIAARRGWGEGGAPPEPGEDGRVRLAAWLADPAIASFVALRRQGGEGEEAAGEEWIHRGGLLELLDWRLAFAALASELAGREGGARAAAAAWWPWLRQLRRRAKAYR